MSEKPVSASTSFGVLMVDSASVCVCVCVVCVCVCVMCTVAMA